MITLFPDGYLPSAPQQAEDNDASCNRDTVPMQATGAPAALAVEPQIRRAPGGAREIARLRAGVLWRLGMDEEHIGAELELHSAEVRFLLKLERLRLASGSGRPPKGSHNFPQAGAGICDSSSAHLAERG